MARSLLPCRGVAWAWWAIVPDTDDAMQTPRTGVSWTKPPRWMRAGSILISFAAITLLATAFGARLYSGSLSSVLLTLVLIALCIAIYLHIRFLVAVRCEQRETANVLD